MGEVGWWIRGRGAFEFEVGGAGRRGSEAGFEDCGDDVRGFEIGEGERGRERGAFTYRFSVFRGVGGCVGEVGRGFGKGNLRRSERWLDLRVG